MLEKYEESLKAKVRALPRKPGVYLMKDRLGSIIYVGKAKNLKNRVSTYFQPGRRPTLGPKIRMLVELIADFEYHVVRSETEALLLEGRLIKELKPKYNTLFTDDKQFIQIRVDLNAELPAFRLVRVRTTDKARYFGPFPHSTGVRRTLAQLRKNMNMQYAIEDGKVYVIEANPRASRTVPLVSKVCNTQMARLATRLMLGESLQSLGLKEKVIPHYGAKEAVFPFSRFPGVDPILGPEMRSTGEVLGLADNYPLAFYKSQEAAGCELPHAPEPWENKKVLISLSDTHSQEEQVLTIGKTLKALGFTILATEGTAAFYESHGIKCEHVNKIGEGRPDVVDRILNNEICLAINTPRAKRNYAEDRKTIRKACLKYKVPYITTLAGALAAVKGIEAVKDGKGGEGGVKSLQEYHAQVK